MNLQQKHPAAEPEQGENKSQTDPRGGGRESERRTGLELTE